MDTDNKSLRTCFRYHLQNASYTIERRAALALHNARLDVAAGTARYPRTGGRQINGTPESRSANTYGVDNRLTWIEDGASVGLRFVGFCDEIIRNRSSRFIDHTGWYMREDGDLGEVCRGVVYQLPARNGRAIYISGYVEGESRKSGFLRMDGSKDSARLALAMRDWNESEVGGEGDSNCGESDSLVQACRDADGLAQRAAEESREYDSAWQLGSQYAGHADDVKATTARAKALRAELKAARALAQSTGAKLPEVCRTLRDSLASMREDIASARESMRKIIDDHCFRGDLRGAFIEGAGLSKVQAFRLLGKA